MRCASGLLAMMLVAAIGCKNQSTTLSNPFLTPDRVPPPSTRVLTPGTAQPYYQGDPVPGTALPGVPVGGYSTSIAPPAGSFGPAPVYNGGAYPSGPMTPITPTPGGATTPPGGWGGYQQPRAESAPMAGLDNGLLAGGGDAVRVPADGQQLRFESPTLGVNDGLALRGAPAVGSTAAVDSAQLRMPIQSLVPSVAPGGAFAPNAGAQAPIQRAAFDEAAPAYEQNGLQRVQIREVTPAEYLDSRQFAAADAAPSVGASTRDGFRPQGSAPRVASAEATAVAGGFRAPEIRRDSMSAETSASRWGVGENRDWLRGQLEYWPETGQWSVRYMDPEGPPDQLGGRVLIENPQVLGNLPPGEFVMVRGQLFGQQLDEASYQPAFRVSTVERQRF